MTTTETRTDELLTVDPMTLLVGTNVRTDADLDAEFVASIKDRGVLEPITVRRDDNGELVVLRGQRRTRAACKAKLPAVRVIVVADPDEIDRITDQVTENFHRKAMTTTDEVAAVEQLSLLGVSAAQIQKRLHIGKDAVATALRVSKSDVAKQAAAAYEFTLDQLGALDEFADEPDTVAKLTEAAPTGKFDHVLQAARDDRDERQQIATRAAELREQGISVVLEQPAYAGGARHLNSLKVKGDHTECPGHLIHLHMGFHWDGAERVRTLSESPYCADWQGNGHTELYSGGGSSSAPTSELSDEEKAEKAAERKLVIANNKAWAAATEMRRAWLRQDLMQRKNTPTGAELFVFTEMLHTPHQLATALDGYVGHRMFRDLMGQETERHQDRWNPGAQQTMGTQLAALRDIAEHQLTTKRVLTLTACLILAAWEDKAEGQTWRGPTATDGRMLRQYEKWGYPLSTIEEETLAACDRDAAAAVESLQKLADYEQDQRDSANEARPASVVTEENADGEMEEVEYPNGHDDDEPAAYEGLDGFTPEPEPEAVTAAEEPAPAPLEEQSDQPDEVGAIVIGGVLVARVEHHDLTADGDPMDDIA
ncbi:ParB/RepB/Spo0J family partition protein [Pseudonocardia sp. T1-2H]|uniref:ParB/RepB/Spo0J family partition protein n=1 Tax=Pseudonocardia sp. T1-2H TaxID=3128899 RepID=UPI00310114F6